MAYRIAQSLAVFRAEANAKWPGRDKSSDGWIGDAAHATRNSDHNPWVIDNKGIGVVRAYDLDGGPGDTDAIGLWVADYVRNKGKAGGFPPLGKGSYVISNRRIADVTSNWNWAPYNGTNPHDKHTHISVALAQSGYDYTGSWGLASSPTSPAAPATTPATSLKRGDRGDEVKELQKVLNRWYPWLNLVVDGVFGSATENAVKELQRRAGIVVDGIAGPQTKAVLHL